MLTPYFHQGAVMAEFGLAIITILALVMVVAPYGRHERKGWGPTMSSRAAWVVMESPAVYLFGLFFLLGQHRFEPVPLLLCGLWMLHYVYRSFVYPFQLQVDGKRVPILIPALAIAFNALNAYVNAFWIGHFGEYHLQWLLDPRFLAGTMLFFGGRHINIQSDRILRSLRQPGQTGYSIPTGGLYRWVSAPNYLGEIIQWLGWALLTCSWAGLAFAVYTAANLVPRAASHHAWYVKTFDNYPTDRRRLLPGIW